MLVVDVVEVSECMLSCCAVQLKEYILEFKRPWTAAGPSGDPSRGPRRGT